MTMLSDQMVLRVLAVFCLSASLSVATTEDGITPVIRIPGDLNILALLHYRSGVDGLRCTGAYRHRVAFDVETLRWAIKSAEEAYLSNRNISLGLTVINPCGSPAIALRDVAAAISGTNTDLDPTGPTIGILLPGIAPVSRLIIEQISQPLGIATIGYFPTEERYLSPILPMVGPSFGMFLDVGRGDIGVVNDVPKPTDAPTAQAAPNTPESPSSEARTTTPLTDALTSTVRASGTTEAANTSGVTGGSGRPVGTSMQATQSDMVQEQDDQDGKYFLLGGPVDPERTYVWSSAVPHSDEASVIRRLLEEAQWSNVGVLYSGYGRGLGRRGAFLEEVNASSICVSFERGIPRGLTQEMADKVIDELIDSSTNNSLVIVWLVLTPVEVATLLRSLRLRSATFYGVGSWPWSNAVKTLPPSLLAEANGTVYIDDFLYEREPEGLKTHLNNLDDAVLDNPWLNRTLTALPNRSDIAFAAHSNSLIRAVDYLFRATDKYLAKTCGEMTGVCQGAYTSENGSIFDELEALGEGKRFTKTYGVNLILNGVASEIGNVTRFSTNLTLSLVETLGALGRSDGCICPNGSLEMMMDDDSRWTHTFTDDPWISVIFGVSVFFGLLAVILFFMHVWFFNYPSMTKSTRVANMILLVGIMMMYFIPLFYTRTPTKLNCGFRQFATAFIHAWVFASLLVKSIGTHLTLNCKNDYAPEYKSRVSKLSKKTQLALFLALMAPQVALSIQWIIMSPPEVESDPDVCGPVECSVTNTHIILSMIYVYVLVSITWSVACSRIREARLVQESRSVALAALCSMFLLIAWALSSTLAEPEYQVPAICIGITANATVIFLACFGPICCVISYGSGIYKPQHQDEKAGDEDAGDEIAYVNPAFLGGNNESATPL